jgi:hypothetical protein
VKHKSNDIRVLSFISSGAPQEIRTVMLNSATGTEVAHGRFARLSLTECMVGGEIGKMHQSHALVVQLRLLS